MKKLFFTTAMLFMSIAGSSTFAQSQEDGDVAINYGVDALDKNWYVSGGVGASMYAGEADRLGSIGSRLAPAIELSIGKWFTPYIGGRLQYSGLYLKGNTFSANNFFASSEANSDGLYSQKMNYMYLHADAMFNISNFIGGYKEDRFYSLIPYAGAGWARTYENKNDAIAVNLGLHNSFRINSSFDVFFDLRGTILGEDAMDAEIGGDYGIDGILTATVGVTYRFGNKGWKRSVPESVIDDYKSTINSNEADLNNCKSQLAKAEKKNADLEEQLAAAKPTADGKKCGVELKIPTTVILFNINSSKLSRISKINLTNIASVMNESSSESKFTVVGYADNGTGSAKVNDRLSKKRAEAVCKFLTDECGVSASKLTLSYKGGVDNMFFDDASLSRAVIIE